MNLEVYIRRLNKTVRSNQHNDKESSRCFVELSEAAALIHDESLLPDFSPSSSLFSFVPFYPLTYFIFRVAGMKARTLNPNGVTRSSKKSAGNDSNHPSRSRFKGMKMKGSLVS